MSGGAVVIALARDPHAAALGLLPWYVRGQLAPDEMQALAEHLQACPRCQAELHAEQQLQALQQSLPPAEVAVGGSVGSGVEAGLARMRARLDEAEPPQAPHPAPRPVGAPRGLHWQPWLPWLPWLVGLQGGAIAVLLLMGVWQPAELPAYRALAARGASAPTTAQALIMFRPDAREQQIREALQASGAILVGGPTESHAYLLRLPREGQQQALQRLRALPFVTLVESLEAAPPAR